MKILHAASLALALCTALACADDDPIEQVSEDIDCEAICDRYQDCFDEGYDVDACKDDCLERADDPNHEDQEEQCDDCINAEDSCVEQAFGCAADCAGIVP